MAVVEHRSINHPLVIFSKVFQVLVVRRDDAKHPPFIEPFQHRLSNGSANLWLGTSTKLINQNQTAFIALLHHLLHVEQMRRVGTQIILQALLITDVDEDTAEEACMTPFMQRDGQTAL